MEEGVTSLFVFSSESSRSLGINHIIPILDFYQEDLGFSDFPPLKDKFGKINFSKNYQSFLFQNVQGIQTNQPLLATINYNSSKQLILFGEGFWKWRVQSYLKNNSFNSFDSFV